MAYALHIERLDEHRMVNPATGQIIKFKLRSGARLNLDDGTFMVVDLSCSGALTCGTVSRSLTAERTTR